MATKIHYVNPGKIRAICGCNQGRKMRSRIAVTSDQSKVTCSKCAQHMEGAAKFAEELAQRLGLS